MAPKRVFKVVVNHEEQYKVQPANERNPPGFKDEGTTGTEDECRARVRKLTAAR